jgi:hypothetical protein
MKGIASVLASKGRGGDTMLMHVAPEEVQYLTRLGGITENPDTGLPEALKFKDFLPFLGSAFLGPAFKAVGFSPTVSSILASTAGTMLGGGSLEKGIMSGLVSSALGRLGTSMSPEAAEAAKGDTGYKFGIFKKPSEGTQFGARYSEALRSPQFNPIEATKAASQGGLDKLLTEFQKPSVMIPFMTGAGELARMSAEEKYQRQVADMQRQTEERRRRAYERNPQILPPSNPYYRPPGMKEGGQVKRKFDGGMLDFEALMNFGNLDFPALRDFMASQEGQQYLSPSPDVIGAAPPYTPEIPQIDNREAELAALREAELIREREQAAAEAEAARMAAIQREAEIQRAAQEAAAAERERQRIEADLFRRAEEARIAEEQARTRAAEEAAQREAQRIAQEQARLEAERQAEMQRQQQLEAQRQAELARAARLAEEARQAEIALQQEMARQAEIQRQAEMQRQEAARAEARRVAAEQARIAEERRQEEARIESERQEAARVETARVQAQQAEQVRLSEIARAEEMAREEAAAQAPPAAPANRVVPPEGYPVGTVGSMYVPGATLPEGVDPLAPMSFDPDASAKLMAGLSLLDLSGLQGLMGTSFADPNIAGTAQIREDTRPGIGGGGKIYEEGALEAAKEAAQDPTKGIWESGFQQLIAEDPEGTLAAIEAKKARDLEALAKIEADYAVMKPISDLLKENKFQEAFALADQNGVVDKLMDTKVLRELRPEFTQQEMRDFFAAIPPGYAGSQFDFKPDVGLYESMDPFGTGTLMESGYPDPNRAFKRKDDKTVQTLGIIAVTAMLAAGLAPIISGAAATPGAATTAGGATAAGGTAAAAGTAGAAATAASLAEVVVIASKLGLTAAEATALIASLGLPAVNALAGSTPMPAGPSAPQPTIDDLAEVLVTGKAPPALNIPPLIPPPSTPVDPPYPDYIEDIPLPEDLEEVVIPGTRPPLDIPPVVLPPSTPVDIPAPDYIDEVPMPDDLEEVIVPGTRPPIDVPPVILPPSTPVDTPYPDYIEEVPLPEELEEVVIPGTRPSLDIPPVVLPPSVPVDTPYPDYIEEVPMPDNLEDKIKDALKDYVTSEALAALLASLAGGTGGGSAPAQPRYQGTGGLGYIPEGQERRYIAAADDYQHGFLPEWLFFENLNPPAVIDTDSAMPGSGGGGGQRGGEEKDSYDQATGTDQGNSIAIGDLNYNPRSGVIPSDPISEDEFNEYLRNKEKEPELGLIIGDLDYNPRSEVLPSDPIVVPPDGFASGGLVMRNPKVYSPRDYLEMVRGYQVGGLSEVAVGQPDSPDSMMTNGNKELVDLTRAVILGEVNERSDEVIQKFIDLYGYEEFQRLRDEALDQMSPGSLKTGLINGDTGGMDDMVDGVIGSQERVAVSPGEFIVPADVVAALGDGNTQKGGKELEKMMERVRIQKYGRNQQPPPVNLKKVMPV